ncbi:ATP-dependent DNA helicase [Aphis craccivora]|uniref:ATP-dependent DNA helicase n=1 Tax=Aphis craccivora TaxID=307492 RepID=A0A6G0Y1C5_APHCR|nr:ATP-dependent DNA helicase [Aphis craccivora]
MFETNIHRIKNLYQQRRRLVLLTAPTGKAAYGKIGLTLHSAFKLPLNQCAGLLPQLSSDISNTLRCQFANVKLLIIDEISMVGIKSLGYIDQRLKSILRINKPFGDINIIVFGDFYQLAPVLSTPLYDIMHLWATNNEVDEMNRRELNSMHQVGFISEAIDTSAKRLDIESAKKLP